MPATKRMTVILVPDTGRRTVTFRFSPLWLAPVVVLMIGLAATAYIQHRANNRLEQSLTELDSLRRTNRLQEAELESLQNKMTETDQKLVELQALESQLREIVGQSLPSRGASTPVDPVHNSGRGGPPGAGQVSSSLPTLGSMLPPEVRAYLFAKRDTLPMDLSKPAVRREAPAETTTAEALSTRMEKQLADLNRVAANLTDGKAAVLEQMDYVAHRPNGLPVSGGTFTDRFGWRWSPFGWGRQWHDGLDIAQDYWTPVVSTGAGTVIHSGWLSGGYGYTVTIDHGYGFVTMYAHLIDTKVAVGAEVKRGTLVGWVGNTGNSTGPHVHYEVHLNGVPVDPVKYLQ